MVKIYKWQEKQYEQLLTQWDVFTSSNKHQNKINWSKRQRGESKAKIIFLVNQAIAQKWKTLPTNRFIAFFAGCNIRWVKKVINKFLGIRKWLAKMNNKVREISEFMLDKQIEIKEIMLKAVFGYYNKHNQLWMYIE